MQVYLDSFGAYLFVRDGMFAVRLKNSPEKTFAVRQVSSILMTRGTALSADAALLAAANDIPVLLIDAYTHHPLGQFSSAAPSGISTLRKNQAVFSRSAAGFEWVASSISQKIKNQRGVLFQLAEMGGGGADFSKNLAGQDVVLSVLQRGFEQWKPPKSGWDEAGAEKIAAQFRGQEGTASRVYFQLLGQFLGEKVGFEGRQKRPAFDPFNVMLNYLYGILYTQCHLALLKVGLDPQMGVLHSDQYARPTLVYDFIEPFRPWADSVAVEIFRKDLMRADFFENVDADDAENASIRLASAGKSVIVEAMLRYLDERADWDGQRVKRVFQVDRAAQRLAFLVLGVERF